MDYYARLGAAGGAAGHTGGFTGRPELARLAGALGGRLSTRGGKRMPLAERERIQGSKAYAATYKRLQAVYEAARRERAGA